MSLTFDLNLRITERMNSELNQLAGQSGQDRSKIVRLALIDFFNNSHKFRSKLNHSVKVKALSGHATIIQELF